MTLQRRIVSGGSVLALIASGCQGPTAPSLVPIAALPRALTSSEQKVIAASNRFAFDLFARLNATQPTSNVFVSPLSASMALGMTVNGAAGQTFDEMVSALRLTSATPQDINEGYRSLIQLLRGLDPLTEFRIANSIWYRNTFAFHESFLNDGKNYFDAEIRAVDFGNPATLETINDWVSTATNAKIPRILDAISPIHVMFLINAIYFNGQWQKRFDRAQTMDAPFHALDGTSAPVPLMSQAGTLRYFAAPDYQAVDLYYGNSAFAMTVILPSPGKSVDGLAQTTSDGAWSELLGSFRETDISLYLPRFRLEWERTLNDDLKALGMNLPFRAGFADFSRMSPAGRDLFIDFVKQKTFVDVDEEGTEAAAATVVGIGVVSMPVRPEMRVDRPFLFAIRERFSGTILFMGKVVKLLPA